VGVLDHIGFLVNGERLPRAPFSGPQSAVVVSADATGVRFAIPSFHADWAFGPARWSRPSAADGYPPAGTPCLVAFAGDDLADPWIVTFAGWPA
jgi:hypothetical protein